MIINYKNEIAVDEVNYLRTSISFRQIHPDQVNAGLYGSAFIVSAYDNNNIVGMARLIWDGGVVALINDLIVVPDYRSQGIETEMIDRILKFLKTKLKPGFGIQIDIKAWGDQQIVYENLGFQLSTTERRGIPMHICLTNHIELTDRMFGQ